VGQQPPDVYEPSVLDRRLIEHPFEVATLVGVGAAVLVGVPAIVVVGWAAGLVTATGVGLLLVGLAVAVSRSMRKQVGRSRPVVPTKWWTWVPGPLFATIHWTVFSAAGLGTALGVDGVLTAALLVVVVVVRRKRGGSSIA
jgi:uncharacterized membrane protein